MSHASAIIASVPNDSSAPVYKLVVSKGYVQLVREGRSQPTSTGRRFSRRYGDWVLLDAGPGNEDIDFAGVWVKEFQASGRPHLHFYVGLPATMRAEDFESLRARTLLRHRLQRQYGRYQGRRHTPPIGLIHGGEFAHWLLSASSEVVGTDNEPDGRHKLRGADVAVMFWNDEAEPKTDRTKVAQYLAREAGKWAQKNRLTGSSRSAGSTGSGASPSVSSPRPPPLRWSPPLRWKLKRGSPVGSTGGYTCYEGTSRLRPRSPYATEATA